KTGDNRPFFIRFFYGVGGMVAGLAVGVLYIWAIVTFVRAGGGIFDAKGSGNGLSELRRHLEKGAASAIIQHADPIPQKTYDLVAKTTRVLTSPEALVAFFETKEMSPLMKYPKFVALIQDEKIQKYASERDYVGIISSPKLHELLTDPEFLEILKKIDYEGAVDRALRHTEPVPSQIPKERFE
ncbi:MAG: hypothetical protein NZL93_03205, partial [Chthoniobacterales bacterium]|nr:hypothetical protein [Chthoniobacterales bacterium]